MRELNRPIDVENGKIICILLVWSGPIYVWDRIPKKLIRRSEKMIWCSLSLEQQLNALMSVLVSTEHWIIGSNWWSYPHLPTTHLSFVCFALWTTPAADRHTRTTTHTTSLLPPPTFISKNVVARVRPITNSVRPGQDVKLQPRVSWAGRKTAAAQCPLHGEDA